MAEMTLLGIDFGVVGSAVAGEVAMSQRVFKKRETCHFPDKEKNKPGLHLITIKERAPSIRRGHKYSNATMDCSVFSSKGTLVAFLKASKRYVKGINMVSASLQRTMTSQILLLIFWLSSKQRHPLTAI